MIYLSMSGAKAAMQRQDVLAHNLANASTPGFRAELQAFRAVPVAGDGASTRVYALESTPSLTCANADRRLALRASEIDGAARRSAHALGVLRTSPAQTVVPDAVAKALLVALFFMHLLSSAASSRRSVTPRGGRAGRSPAGRS